MTRRFAVTFDYLCPFARNANEHVAVALADGADWDVEFAPFSLKQVHVRERGTPVWEVDDPTVLPGVRALLVGIAVAELEPDRFLDAHLELFAARHDHGLDIRDERVVRGALREAGVDPDRVLAEIDTGEPIRLLRKAHERAAEVGVFGVPTFVVDDHAVFVRLMDRPRGDAARARRTVERVLDLLEGWPELNEFKHTRIAR